MAAACLDGSSAYAVTDLTPLVVTVMVTEPGRRSEAYVDSCTGKDTLYWYDRPPSSTSPPRMAYGDELDAHFVDMPLLLIHGQPAMATIILEWWQRCFDCRIFEHRWNHATMSEVFEGWTNLILTHIADFEEIDDMMELKYALPEPITGIEHITVEPEIMKLIEFVNRQVGHPSIKIPKHAVSANVLPVLHGYFLRFFRLHLNRCRITRMRLDTFYLNENGSINLTETKYGNLSLYILDQLALFACAANGWGLQWRHVHSM
ncbi:kinetochore complex Sim4 subunit Fta1-domain-containing protein [Syncephalis pseudoplumigaleata]|uniref:Kinetochore complex Sim4 subunit Fta1-domain-containing protein n=1 Tax=Syncephalis pseudoplumigaleata TaxID=1712513 RepID=A0A4P9YRF5_9FUNG|nr:kinetochore complex Sim4 subunit Fta1-domain-containing protein [Syncephalis pseudoplumigaleata]|eukprot:RKP22265.1 kinetochore complex Sim4 subunit Fta1-domain-containing protein [Syncephalis pseudoplumigaleata]